MIRRALVLGRILAPVIAAILLHAGAASADTVPPRRDASCPAGFNYGVSQPFYYQAPGATQPIQVSFTFGESQTFSAPGSAHGTYPFADIKSPGGNYILRFISVHADCYQLQAPDGSWGTTQKTLSNLQGTVYPLYYADDQQLYCNGIPVDDNSQCTNEGGGGGGSGGGGGGNTLQLCWWTDYYDDFGNYLFTIDHGCTVL